MSSSESKCAIYFESIEFELIKNLNDFVYNKNSN
jgi:hypothetical protein